MTDVLRIQRNDLTAAEILEKLETGNRVVIEIDFVGKTMQMAIRKRGETYYCDTPVKLLKYETPEEMRTCLERYKLARSETKPDTDDPLGAPQSE